MKRGQNKLKQLIIYLAIGVTMNLSEISFILYPIKLPFPLKMKESKCE